MLIYFINLILIYICVKNEWCNKRKQKSS
ncbi:MAG: hypothetical protein HOO91_19600 [Bacteroidales bacterium]|nr:hypothetical protein [Bacteroidales bacterium]